MSVVTLSLRLSQFQVPLASLASSSYLGRMGTPSCPEQRRCLVPGGATASALHLLHMTALVLGEWLRF